LVGAFELDLSEADATTLTWSLERVAQNDSSITGEAMVVPRVERDD
jgi:hypothetical protein